MLLWVVTLSACAASAPNATAPRPSAPDAVIVEATLTEIVREQLAAAWDTVDAYQVERLYCGDVADLDDGGDGEPIKVVVAIIAPPKHNNAATPATVDATCFAGTVLFLHTHPPTSRREDGSRYTGGPGAYQCFPTATDRRFLAELASQGVKYGAVQCDRYAVVVYRVAAPGRE